jgi:RecB family exonuclease
MMSDLAPLAYGRDAHGRFTAGNGAAKGRAHPFARKAAALRKAFFDEVKPADMRRVVRTLVTEATGGNLQAARLLLLWVLGKPSDPVHPDAVEHLIAAEAQADQAPSSLPTEREAGLDLAVGPDTDLHRELERLADPEARLDLAARALAAEIRILRGMTTVPGGIDLPALEDHD